MEPGNADFAKWALSGEDIVLSFQHILQGEMIKPEQDLKTLPDGNTYTVPKLVWVKVSRSLLNDEGIQQITSTLYSFLNRSVFLSNLSELRTMGLARRILLSVNKKLLLSTQPYKDKNGDYIYANIEIKQPDGTKVVVKQLKTQFDMVPEDFEQIIASLEGLLIPSLLRAYQEGERKFFAHTEQTVRQVVSTDKAQQPQGLFGIGGK